MNDSWERGRKGLSHEKAFLSGPALHGNMDWHIYLITMAFPTQTDFIQLVLAEPLPRKRLSNGMLMVEREPL